MASDKPKDGIEDCSISYYSGGSYPDLFASVHMCLTENEFREFETWLNSRKTLKNPPPTTPPNPVELLEFEIQRLNEQIRQHRQIENLEFRHSVLKAQVDAIAETKERKNYPHVFNHGGYCTYCEADPGLFGRNEGKPCHNRYLEEKDKKKEEPVPIVIVLREKNHVRHIYFRTPEGKLLNPGKYVGKIVEVRVEKDEN